MNTSMVPEICVQDMPITFDDGGNCYYLLSPYLDIRILVSSSLPLPKSGRYFVEALKNIDFKGKKVLDIGTGYFGYLAKLVKHFGAKKVVAVDINERVIEHAKNFNNSKIIDFRISDVYSGLDENEKFDIVISNPALLPVKSKTRGKVHDYGGKNGLSMINRIINGFPIFSEKKSILYLLIFDFLYNKIGDLCKKKSLSCKVVGFYNKKVRKGGETEKQIDYIKKIYPGYQFTIDNGVYSHKIFILEIKYENHN